MSPADKAELRGMISWPQLAAVIAAMAGIATLHGKVFLPTFLAEAREIAREEIGSHEADGAHDDALTVERFKEEMAKERQMTKAAIVVGLQEVRDAVTRNGVRLEQIEQRLAD